MYRYMISDWAENEPYVLNENHYLTEIEMSFQTRVGSMTFGKGEIQSCFDNRTPK